MNNLTHISNCLDQLSILHHRVEDRAIILQVASSNTVYTVYIETDPILVTFRAVPHLIIPESRVAEAVTLINLINATRLQVGAFWFHPRERILTWEYSLLTAEPVSPMVLLAVHSAARAVDHFFPAFMHVIWSGGTPEDALQALREQEAQDGNTDEDDDRPDFEIAV